MIPGVDNETHIKGDTYSRVYQFNVNGSPLDLSGSGVAVVIYQKGASAPGMTLTVGNGVTIAGTGNNELHISKIVDLPIGKWWRKITVTFPSGQVTTYVQGVFKIENES